MHRSGGIIEPNWLWRDIPGIALCALIACAATWMTLLAGSAVIWGLILGLVLAATTACLTICLMTLAATLDVGNVLGLLLLPVGGRLPTGAGTGPTAALR